MYLCFLALNLSCAECAFGWQSTFQHSYVRSVPRKVSLDRQYHRIFFLGATMFFVKFHFYSYYKCVAHQTIKKNCMHWSQWVTRNVQLDKNWGESRSTLINQSLYPWPLQLKISQLWARPEGFHYRVPRKWHLDMHLQWAGTLHISQMCLAPKNKVEIRASLLDGFGNSIWIENRATNNETTYFCYESNLFLL